MDSTKCRICGLALSTASIVRVSVGMKKLFECSVSKNDGLFIDDSLESVVIHVHCRKSYTRRVSKIPSPETFDFARYIYLFDFLTLCLFCDETCSKDSKLVGRKSQDVHLVNVLFIKIKVKL